MSNDLTTIRTVGGLLPPDVLSRVLAGDKDLAGLSSADYHLAAGESPREAANRSWAYLTGVWSGYRNALAKLPEGDPAVGVTREKWLLVLLRELGYGRVPVTSTGGIVVDERAFPVSHLWERTPIHLLGWGVELDRRTKGVPGAAERAPHAMVQELLNRTDDYLWAMVSNGRVLRLLRDSTSLSGQAFVEFDLEAMFDGEVFSDFVLLFLLLHQSRVEVAQGAPVSECWLERWRTSAAEQGTRALGLLRDGVKRALESLGTGFLQANPELNQRIADGELRLDDYHRALLRTVYRLLFLFVVEDRGALLSPEAGPVERQRYYDYFSTARLRRLSLRRRGSRHGDLWEALSVVIDALGREEGRPELGLPGIGGLFDHGPQDVVMGQRLPNEALLTAVRGLTVVHPKGQPRRTVDYRNLGAEELGSIYESLLELVPRHERVQRLFTLEDLAGNDRKTSGSYYTPTALIDLVLDEALDPLLDEAEKAADPEAALLALTVCDPACGSGHFLVAAARRIAARVAMARTGEVDATPASLQEALHDVVARCIYGVDLNPMAADLAKVSLWLEAATPGKPLSFLDAHIKVGNALLGATPALLAQGIPDAAYDPIEGDDKKYAAALKKRNRIERDAELAQQGDLFEVAALDVSNAALRREIERWANDIASARSLTDLHLAQRRYREFEASRERLEAVRRADRWCAAFAVPKVPGGVAITHHQLERPSAEVQQLVGELASQYRFFHWHLEFPEIFSVPGSPSAGSSTGWVDGFRVMVGNPPWETLQMSEREFFASRDESIAAAANAAARKRAISQLAVNEPRLFAEFQEVLRRVQVQTAIIRGGRFPLCATGKINTYSVFAEHFASAVAVGGRAGLLTPTGLATDATTSSFFASVVSSRRLAAFYDFENEARIFKGVHNQFRFAISVITGGVPVEAVRLAFYTRYIEDVPTRRFQLTAEEILLLNPNTGTMPIFRSRKDAEITLGIYRRHPVLVQDGAENPWKLTFAQGLFNMASDSSKFLTMDDLAKMGAVFNGWSWALGGELFLPLYEAKMLHIWNHRSATYLGASRAQLNKGTLPRLTDDELANPDLEPLARYWLDAREVATAVPSSWSAEWFLGWRDIAGASNVRTFIPSALPRSAVGDSFLLAFAETPALTALLHVIWSTLVFDFVSRQKQSGAHMKYFATKQLPCPRPELLSEKAAWAPSTVAEWLADRAIELSYTSWRMRPYADALCELRTAGASGQSRSQNPFVWDPTRRPSRPVEWCNSGPAS
jgi:hypothetical protein